MVNFNKFKHFSTRFNLIYKLVIDKNLNKTSTKIIRTAMCTP